MPGSDNLLKLSKKMQFRMALASSNCRQHIIFALNKFKWENYFSVILGEEDVKEGKPSPDLFLKAAKLIKVQPQNCVVFEDSYNGLLAAKSAEMRCVLVNKNIGNRSLKSLDEIDEKFLKNLWA